MEVSRVVLLVIVVAVVQAECASIRRPEQLSNNHLSVPEYADKSDDLKYSVSEIGTSVSVAKQIEPDDSKGDVATNIKSSDTVNTNSHTITSEDFAAKTGAVGQNSFEKLGQKDNEEDKSSVLEKETSSPVKPEDQPTSTQENHPQQNIEEVSNVVDPSKTQNEDFKTTSEEHTTDKLNDGVVEVDKSNNDKVSNNFHELYTSTTSNENGEEHDSEKIPDKQLPPQSYAGVVEVTAADNIQDNSVSGEGGGSSSSESTSMTNIEDDKKLQLASDNQKMSQLDNGVVEITGSNNVALNSDEHVSTVSDSLTDIKPPKENDKKLENTQLDKTETDNGETAKNCDEGVSCISMESGSSGTTSGEEHSEDKLENDADGNPNKLLDENVGDANEPENIEDSTTCIEDVSSMSLSELSLQISDDIKVFSNDVALLWEGKKGGASWTLEAEGVLKDYVDKIGIAQSANNSKCVLKDLENHASRSKALQGVIESCRSDLQREDWTNLQELTVNTLNQITDIVEEAVGAESKVSLDDPYFTNLKMDIENDAKTKLQKLYSKKLYRTFQESKDKAVKGDEDEYINCIDNKPEKGMIVDTLNDIMRIKNNCVG